MADEDQQALRDVVCYGVQNGSNNHILSGYLSYYDSYRSAVLPAT
ncbi:hypothetical protein ACNKHP_22490 [Shigella boydii]